MKIVTEPSVYLIGKSQLDRDELHLFLASVGASDWTTAGDVDGEILVEVGARTCYQSWKGGRPHREHLTHLIEVGHLSCLEHSVFTVLVQGVSRSLCYLPGTEVLTEDGWACVEDLKAGDRILTKCPRTGVCRWSVNKRLLTMPHDGPVHWFENSEWKSPGFTPNHLVWAARYDLRKCRDLSCREIADRHCEKVPFAAVEGKRLVVDHEIRTIGSDPATVRIGPHEYRATAFFEWLGWCLTDGGAAKLRKACYVTQTKPGGWGRIVALMDELFPGRWRPTEGRSGQKVARIYDAELWQYVCDNFGRLKRGRRLTALFGFSRRLIESFLSGVVGGDGNVHPDSGHTVVYCNNPTTAGDLQVLFSMTGRSGCVRVFAPAGRSHRLNGTLVKSNQPEVLVSVHKTTASLVTASHQHKVWYRGLVHCPETDDGLVYVRRKGHGVWSGNTHELIRHRHLSPSQLSQRYVDESVAEYVVPDIIWEDAELREMWVEAVRHAHAAYVALAEKLKAKIERDTLASRDGDHEWKCSGCFGSGTAVRFGQQAFNEDGVLVTPLIPVGKGCPKCNGSGLAAGAKTGIRKAARQAARSVLPNATETKIQLTANARAWREFLAKRGSRHAEPEIRKLAGAVLGLLLTDSPNLFGDVEISVGADGLPLLHVPGPLED